MKQAVKGASNWLKEHTKRNPVPYKLFESILNRQVKWGNDRGVTIDFGELSEAVKAELLKAGIYVMSPDGKQEGNTASMFTDGEFQELRLKNDRSSLSASFKGLADIIERASRGNCTELVFTVKAN